MKMTALDIQQQKFRLRIRGFDVGEVDGFLERVAGEFDALSKKNKELQKEIERLGAALERYKDQEMAVKEAMINTQKTLDDMKVNAEKEAELIVTEAEIKAEKILSRAHNRLTQLHEDITELKRQRIHLEVELGSILEAHRKLLDMSTEAMQAKEASEEKLTYLKGS
jgi:cell division initiation protein